MKPDVLLVFCMPVEPNEFMGALIPPLGLECIAAYIRDIANVRIVDTRFDKNIPVAIREHRPTIIGINVKNTVRSQHAYAMARRCRLLCPEALLVAGGLHVTCVPEEALSDGLFDVVVRGDGELTFREIAAGLPLERLAGISYRSRGRVVHNEDRPLVVDLDQFPHPARELRPDSYRYSILQGRVRADIIETSRGCTNACTFCSPASFHQGRWRYHSPRYVVVDGEACIRLTSTSFVL